MSPKIDCQPYQDPEALDPLSIALCLVNAAVRADESSVCLGGSGGCFLGAGAGAFTPSGGGGGGGTPSMGIDVVCGCAVVVGGLMGAGLSGGVCGGGSMFTPGGGGGGASSTLELGAGLGLGFAPGGGGGGGGKTSAAASEEATSNTAKTNQGENRLSSNRIPACF